MFILFQTSLLIYHPPLKYFRLCSLFIWLSNIFFFFQFCGYVLITKDSRSYSLLQSSCSHPCSTSCSFSPSYRGKLSKWISLYYPLSFNFYTSEALYASPLILEPGILKALFRFPIGSGLGFSDTPELCFDLDFISGSYKVGPPVDLNLEPGMNPFPQISQTMYWNRTSLTTNHKKPCNFSSTTLTLSTEQYS